MASPVYRGDDPGFQTQAVGNYPAKSDVADKDNIYLSDQGWVYRHFKNVAKTKYWDEVIWAGDVTNPPAANAPVGIFGEEAQTFNVGDGIQAVNGPYPAADPTIGVVAINGSNDVSTGSAEAYSLTASGSIPGTATYLWSTTPATSTISASTAATTNITFTADDTYEVKCIVKTSASATTGAIGRVGVESTTHAQTTIGTVSVSGRNAVDTSETVVYTAAHTGDAPNGDITYGWTTTDGTATVTPNADGTKANISFGTDGTYTVTCEMVDAGSSDTPQSGTLSNIVVTTA